jgi:apolipoprotein N-acyltransferase
LSYNVFYKTGYIFLLSFINPFGFNWFKLELPFINSYIGTSKLEFFLILISMALFFQFRKKYRKTSYVSIVVFLCILPFFNYFNQKNILEPKLKISQYQTHITQSEKWNNRYKKTIIDDNFSAIQKAINHQNDLIVLPETAFPIVLNRTEKVNDKLLALSEHIAIVTGSLYEKEGLLYNSTYFYDKGKIQVAHKVVLVPFGEAIPLPEKIRNIINDIIYNGAKDYETAKSPTTFIINGIKFRNAICYEATTDEIYKDLDTPYIIVTSNNAWFTPSIQPTLQKLLMKYYKKKYNLHYLNVTNQ